MTPEELAARLRWPDARLCDWDCPWPRYCLECHEMAHEAMLIARRNVCEFMAQRPLQYTKAAPSRYVAV